jgi:hypothetical protein
MTTRCRFFDRTDLTHLSILLAAQKAAPRLHITTWLKLALLWLVQPQCRSSARDNMGLKPAMKDRISSCAGPERTSLSSSHYNPDTCSLSLTPDAHRR